MDGTSESSGKLNRDEEQQAEKMAQFLDPDIAVAVRANPSGAVALAVLNSNGSNDGVMRELARLGPAAAPTPELQRMVQQYVQHQQAINEADNRAAVRLAGGLLAAEIFSVGASNTALAEQQQKAEEKRAAEGGKSYGEMSKAERDMFYSSMLTMSAEDWRNKSEAQRQHIIDINIQASQQAIDKSNRNISNIESGLLQAGRSPEEAKGIMDKGRAAGARMLDLMHKDKLSLEDARDKVTQEYGAQTNINDIMGTAENVVNIDNATRAVERQEAERSHGMNHNVAVSAAKDASHTMETAKRLAADSAAGLQLANPQANTVEGRQKIVATASMSTNADADAAEHGATNTEAYNQTALARDADERAGQNNFATKHSTKKISLDEDEAPAAAKLAEAPTQRTIANLDKLGHGRNAFDGAAPEPEISVAAARHIPPRPIAGAGLSG